MMSEEELKTVEWLKRIIDYYKKDIKSNGKGWNKEETLKNYEILLNIIEREIINNE